MSRPKFTVTVHLKSGQSFTFVTDDLTVKNGSMNWGRNNEHRGSKLLHLDYDQIAAVTYE